MHHLDIIKKFPEPKPDGIIRIRPGESTIVRIDGGDPEPEIRGRPAAWREKTIPALIITIGDDPCDILRIFKAGDDPEDAVPFLAISPDRDALLACRADGKILCRETADPSPGPSGSMQYLHKIIAKTEYCILLCSRMTPDRVFLAGEIARSARDQNTLMVLAFISDGEVNSVCPAFFMSRFHTVILESRNPPGILPASLERIRDLCEATLDDIVASGGRHSLEPDDRRNVRELFFNGGICLPPWHTTGKPDACELLRGYFQSVLPEDQTRIAGTYSILKIPWDSTVDDAIRLRNSLYDILDENIPSVYPHMIRIEGHLPETGGHCDLSTWTFSGHTDLPRLTRCRFVDTCGVNAK